ncbi:MAG: 1-phosphofructokinase family hexose kinase, partial [bacterium]
ESQGARVIVDSSGEALNFALKSTPFMIKPNLAEFQELTGRRLESVDEIVDEAIKVHNMGVEFVVVSMKENGAIGVTSSGVIWAKPPNVFAKNSVGAGDSLVAGVIAALESGKDYVEALTLGVASGTATALKEGTAKANKDDVLQILKEVTIKRI